MLLHKQSSSVIFVYKNAKKFLLKTKNKLIQWGTHGLIEIGVRPVTERSLVRTTPWLFYVVCCARR